MEFVMEVIKDELIMLRNELQQLKHCQLQYFTFSITGTAAIFGAIFGFALQKNIEWFIGFSFLVPLTIILPCWFIFFDKATTITRIVGYYRVLERMISYPNYGIKHIGYECALAFYRIEDDGGGHKKMKDSERCKKLREELKETSKSKNIRHRYWIINWYTYLMLSIICCLISIIIIFKSNGFHYSLIISIIAFSFVIFTARKIWKLLKSVTNGDYSYNENHIFWEYIHEIKS